MALAPHDHPAIRVPDDYDEVVTEWALYVYLDERHSEVAYIAPFFNPVDARMFARKYNCREPWVVGPVKKYYSHKPVTPAEYGRYASQ